jgi:hypothetical protein
MSVVSTLVEKLKQSNQDFEFYPTTQSMIDKVYGHMASCRYRNHRSSNGYSILDIGAGNGAFLKAAKKHELEAELFAIEKSEVLIRELVTFAKVIGTDFYAQSFLNKKANVIFCNPPYSDYVTWATKIIRESSNVDIYLVIPQRWRDNAEIAHALEFRKAKAIVIHSDNFLEADRKARAYVDIIYIKMPADADELFEEFFFERFGGLKEKAKSAPEDIARQETEKRKKRQGLVKRDGLVGALVELYNLELAELQSNYDKAATMDQEVLQALGLEIRAIITVLREKLDTLKNEYWDEVFKRLDTITTRLTNKNRRNLLNTIGGLKAVDFTAENIYAIVLWIMEHANKYLDKQILEMFDRLLCPESLRNYKSNQRVFDKGEWRYRQAPENMSHVSLDFRILLTRAGGISAGYSGYSLSTYAEETVGDLLTLANLLGFNTYTTDANWLESEFNNDGELVTKKREWDSGVRQLYKTTDGEDLLEVKAFYNGNLHLRLSQKLCIALNVAVGKLRGWLRNHDEAREEFGEVAEQYFDNSYSIKPEMLLIA